jgi:hypothetical protein
MSSNSSSGFIDGKHEIMPGTYNFNDGPSDLHNNDVTDETNTSDRGTIATSFIPTVPISAIRNLAVKTKPITDGSVTQNTNRDPKAIKDDNDADINQAIPQPQKNNSSNERSVNTPVSNESPVQMYQDPFIKEYLPDVTSSDPYSEHKADNSVSLDDNSHSNNSHGYNQKEINAEAFSINRSTGDNEKHFKDVSGDTDFGTTNEITKKSTSSKERNKNGIYMEIYDDFITVTNLFINTRGNFRPTRERNR